MTIRPCRDDERPAMLAIINAAAEAYRGVIPPDRWHDPYMAAAELDSEIADGVAFWGYEDDGELAGVMGIQPVRDVTLIRHAYVDPGRQRGGIGGALLEHLLGRATQPMLVGTWADAGVGDQLLRAARLRARLAGAQDRAAEGLLDDPRPPDRDIRRAREAA